MANQKLKIIYRSNAHATLWLVADKSGCWNKNGLDVDTSPQLVRERAVESLKNGHVDLISGNQLNSRAGFEPRSRPKGMLAPFGNPI